MNKGKLELFAKAVNEGFNKKIYDIVSDYTEEIICSQNHSIAIRTIIYGKSEKNKNLSPKAKRLIIILVAAALLLASCGIIFRDQIRSIVIKISETYNTLTFSEEKAEGGSIEDVYELTYVPEGYLLNSSEINDVIVSYTYLTEDEEILTLNQWIIDNSKFVYDTENSEMTTITIDEYSVNHIITSVRHFYLWNNGKYSFELSSSLELPIDELKMIMNGLKLK